jgi:hypothetical protein
MRKPRSMNALEDFGRVRLSPNFFMRDFLYSEIAGFHGVPNLPDDPDLAIAAGRQLCETLLEPLQATFGRLAIRSGFRSRRVTEFGHRGGAAGMNTAYPSGTARCRRLHRRRRDRGGALVRRPLRAGGRLARHGVVDPRPPAVCAPAVLSSPPSASPVTTAGAEDQILHQAARLLARPAWRTRSSHADCAKFPSAAAAGWQ